MRDEAMRKEKRESLEAAGFRLGDAEEFLELSDEERGLLNARHPPRSVIAADSDEKSDSKDRREKR